jgi:DNA-binding MarR family transcriptional regulator
MTDATLPPGEPADGSRGLPETSLEPLAHRVSAGLAKVGIAMRHASWERAGSSGLHPAQATVLALLHAGGGAPQRLGELAHQMGVDSAAAGDSVSALARNGFVEQEAVPDDARAVDVSLTERGRAEAEATAGWPDALAEVVDELSPGEQAVFLRGLVKMIRALQVRGKVPPARMCATCTYFGPFAHPGTDRPHHCHFVDAPFGDAELRIECADQQPADAPQAAAIWRRFFEGEQILGVAVPLPQTDPRPEL